MEYFSYHGQPIAYVRKGTGDPVLFLHNGGTAHGIWQFQLDALSEHYQVFALDLPGYGQSAPSKTGYSLEAYTDAIAEFIAANMPNQRVTLVGNCMGSAIALNYARREPSRVQALVLINPLSLATFREGSVGALLQIKKAVPILSNGITWGLSRLRVPSIAVTPGIQLQLGDQGFKRRLWKNATLRKCYEAPDILAALTGLYNELPGFNTLYQFMPEKCFPPIYTIWGQQNRVLSAKAGAQLNASLRPKIAMVLEDCGHLSMLERPQEVTQLIATACLGGQ